MGVVELRVIQLVGHFLSQLEKEGKEESPKHQTQLYTGTSCPLHTDGPLTRMEAIEIGAFFGQKIILQERHTHLSVGELVLCLKFIGCPSHY